MQLLFVWNALPAMIPALTGTWFTPFMAAALALAINEGAYAAEIVRGGLLSIDDGQKLAARALGLSPWRTFRRVDRAPAGARDHPAHVQRLHHDAQDHQPRVGHLAAGAAHQHAADHQLHVPLRRALRRGRPLVPRHREHLHGHPGADREAVRVDLARAGRGHGPAAQRG